MSGDIRLVMVRFLVVFSAGYFACQWLLTGSGPVAGINSAISWLTTGQIWIAEHCLIAFGEPVLRIGDILQSAGGFSCAIAEGCNGMAAINLVLAGTLAFPATVRSKAAGLLLLVPGVLFVNVIRICALYWSGAHKPGWFFLLHVYVGQVVVILFTALLWLIWLSWTSRRHAALS